MYLASTHGLAEADNICFHNPGMPNGLFCFATSTRNAFVREAAEKCHSTEARGCQRDPFH
ncbi:hypothetical protein ZHAS_00006323 [Anopheles sinensis]|uniref:Uncharacterized protein n=1 Tax=Anopheles sinensis TaxID=74873 RepID=A0A084VLJ3_ANOSI|nr:hypothetical protein ZHAS_00006323 [Anopheles sinensis]